WYDDAGFLSKSALHSLPVGYTVEGVNWIEVESSLYTPIIQGFVVSEMGLQNTSAIKFIDFLLSPEAQAIYKAHGYK
ncbi:substrate-binding domain-containing protein, partial [bacterium]|nr:substrate-binding domain-containing protein [bacterium]